MVFSSTIHRKRYSSHIGWLQATIFQVDLVTSRLARHKLHTLYTERHHRVTMFDNSELKNTQKLSYFTNFVQKTSANYTCLQCDQTDILHQERSTFEILRKKNINKVNDKLNLQRKREESEICSPFSQTLQVSLKLSTDDVTTFRIC